MQYIETIILFIDSFKCVQPKLTLQNLFSAQFIYQILDFVIEHKFKKKIPTLTTKFSSHVDIYNYFSELYYEKFNELQPSQQFLQLFDLKDLQRLEDFEPYLFNIAIILLELVPDQLDWKDFSQQVKQIQLPENPESFLLQLYRSQRQRIAHQREHNQTLISQEIQKQEEIQQITEAQKQQIEQQQNKIQELEINIHQLQEELQQVKSKHYYDILQKEEELKPILNHLNCSSIEEILQRVKILQGQISKLQKEKNQYETQMADHEKAMEDLHHKFEKSFKKRIEELQNSIDVLKEQKISDDFEIQELKENNRNLNFNTFQLKSQLSQLEETNKRKEERIFEFQIKIKQNEREINDLQNKLSESQREQREVAQSINEKNQQLHQVSINKEPLELNLKSNGGSFLKEYEASIKRNVMYPALDRRLTIVENKQEEQDKIILEQDIPVEVLLVKLKKDLAHTQKSKQNYKKKLEEKNQDIKKLEKDLQQYKKQFLDLSMRLSSESVQRAQMTDLSPQKIDRDQSKLARQKEILERQLKIEQRNHLDSINKREEQIHLLSSVFIELQKGILSIKNPQNDKIINQEFSN